MDYRQEWVRSGVFYPPWIEFWSLPLLAVVLPVPQNHTVRGPLLRRTLYTSCASVSPCADCRKPLQLSLPVLCSSGVFYSSLQPQGKAGRGFPIPDYGFASSKAGVASGSAQLALRCWALWETCTMVASPGNPRVSHSEPSSD